MYSCSSRRSLRLKEREQAEEAAALDGEMAREQRRRFEWVPTVTVRQDGEMAPEPRRLFPRVPTTTAAAARPDVDEMAAVRCRFERASRGRHLDRKERLDRGS